jgi:hypothetical protein
MNSKSSGSQPFLSREQKLLGCTIILLCFTVSNLTYLKKILLKLK